jgi:hypothetical protein
MEIILREKVENLGGKGDIIKSVTVMPETFSSPRIGGSSDPANIA